MKAIFAAVLAPVAALFFPGKLPAQTAQRVAAGFSSPLFATSPPNDASRLFIVEQGTSGTASVRILNLGSNTINSTPFLTLNSGNSGIVTGGEQGLLGLAFAPDYATSGKFYVNFTAGGGAFGQGVTNIREYTVSANPDIANPASARTILQIDQPQTNHNGGWIGFSPRAGDFGNLYIAMGDGGSGDDQGAGHVAGGNAQSTTSLLGKMLRIDVNTDAFPADPNKSYGIPANNPYASGAQGAPEVFTLGLRNPFRDSFDRQTGNLLIGDVGQNTREEVDVQKASNPGGGENYGWRVREGFVQNPAYPNAPVPSGAVDPILDYARAVGRSVIGGYIYRGSAIPSLAGKYVFGDYLGDNNLGDVFTLDFDGTTASNFQTITNTLFPAGGLSGPASFGEDAAGELYVLSQGSGEVYKIVPEPASAALALIGAPLFGVRPHRKRMQS